MVMAVMEARAAANAAARAGKGSRQTPGKPPPAKFSEYKANSERAIERETERRERERRRRGSTRVCALFYKLHLRRYYNLTHKMQSHDYIFDSANVHVLGIP